MHSTLSAPGRKSGLSFFAMAQGGLDARTLSGRQQDDETNAEVGTVDNLITQAGRTGGQAADLATHRVVLVVMLGELGPDERERLAVKDAPSLGADSEHGLGVKHEGDLEVRVSRHPQLAHLHLRHTKNGPPVAPGCDTCLGVGKTATHCSSVHDKRCGQQQPTSAELLTGSHTTDTALTMSAPGWRCLPRKNGCCTSRPHQTCEVNNHISKVNNHVTNMVEIN
jgi:hypothetical protein